MISNTIALHKQQISECAFRDDTELPGYGLPGSERASSSALSAVACLSTAMGENRQTIWIHLPDVKEVKFRRLLTSGRRWDAFIGAKD